MQSGVASRCYDDDRVRDAVRKLTTAAGDENTTRLDHATQSNRLPRYRRFRRIYDWNTKSHFYPDLINQATADNEQDDDDCNDPKSPSGTFYRWESGRHRRSQSKKYPRWSSSFRRVNDGPVTMASSIESQPTNPDVVNGTGKSRRGELSSSEQHEAATTCAEKPLMTAAKKPHYTFRRLRFASSSLNEKRLGGRGDNKAARNQTTARRMTRRLSDPAAAAELYDQRLDGGRESPMPVARLSTVNNLSMTVGEVASYHVVEYGANPVTAVGRTRNAIDSRRRWNNRLTVMINTGSRTRRQFVRQKCRRLIGWDPYGGFDSDESETGDEERGKTNGGTKRQEARVESQAQSKVERLESVTAKNDAHAANGDGNVERVARERGCVPRERTKVVLENQQRTADRDASSMPRIFVDHETEGDPGLGQQYHSILPKNGVVTPRRPGNEKQNENNAESCVEETNNDDSNVIVNHHGDESVEQVPLVELPAAMEKMASEEDEIEKKSRLPATEKLESTEATASSTVETRSRIINEYDQSLYQISTNLHQQTKTVAFAGGQSPDIRRSLDNVLRKGHWAHERRQQRRPTCVPSVPPEVGAADANGVLRHGGRPETEHQAAAKRRVVTFDCTVYDLPAVKSHHKAAKSSVALKSSLVDDRRGAAWKHGDRTDDVTIEALSQDVIVECHQTSCRISEVDPEVNRRHVVQNCEDGNLSDFLKNCDASLSAINRGLSQPTDTRRKTANQSGDISPLSASEPRRQVTSVIMNTLTTSDLQDEDSSAEMDVVSGENQKNWVNDNDRNVEQGKQRCRSPDTFSLTTSASGSRNDMSSVLARTTTVNSEGLWNDVLVTQKDRFCVDFSRSNDGNSDNPLVQKRIPQGRHKTTSSMTLRSSSNQTLNVPRTRTECGKHQLEEVDKRITPEQPINGSFAVQSAEHQTREIAAAHSTNAPNRRTAENAHHSLYNYEYLRRSPDGTDIDIADSGSMAADQQPHGWSKVYTVTGFPMQIPTIMNFSTGPGLFRKNETSLSVTSTESYYNSSISACAGNKRSDEEVAQDAVERCRSRRHPDVNWKSLEAELDSDRRRRYRYVSERVPSPESFVSVQSRPYYKDQIHHRSEPCIQHQPKKPTRRPERCSSSTDRPISDEYEPLVSPYTPSDDHKVSRRTFRSEDRLEYELPVNGGSCSDCVAAVEATAVPIGTFSHRFIALENRRKSIDDRKYWCETYDVGVGAESQRAGADFPKITELIWRLPDRHSRTESKMRPHGRVNETTSRPTIFEAEAPRRNKSDKTLFDVVASAAKCSPRDKIPVPERRHESPAEDGQRLYCGTDTDNSWIGVNERRSDASFSTRRRSDTVSRSTHPIDRVESVSATGSRLSGERFQHNDDGYRVTPRSNGTTPRNTDAIRSLDHIKFIDDEDVDVPGNSSRKATECVAAFRPTSLIRGSTGNGGSGSKPGSVERRVRFSFNDNEHRSRRTVDDCSNGRSLRGICKNDSFMRSPRTQKTEKSTTMTAVDTLWQNIVTPEQANSDDSRLVGGHRPEERSRDPRLELGKNKLYSGKYEEVNAFDGRAPVSISSRSEFRQFCHADNSRNARDMTPNSSNQQLGLLTGRSSSKYGNETADQRVRFLSGSRLSKSASDISTLKSLGCSTRYREETITDQVIVGAQSVVDDSQRRSIKELVETFEDMASPLFRVSVKTKN